MTASDPESLGDYIDKILDGCAPREAHELLYLFSYHLLERFYPEFIKKNIGFGPDDLKDLQRVYRGRPPSETFANIGAGPISRRDLLMNLYQAAQENSDMDGVAEAIYWAWAALEKEGYSQGVISEAFRGAFGSFLEHRKQ